jgi:hypothetical protein
MAGAGHHAAELELIKTALREGIRLQPSAEPDLLVFPNTPAVQRNIQLCKERIDYYFDIGALEVLTERPELLQPLHVVDRPGRKARIVLDLSRNLNDVIEHESFHMQSIQTAVQLSSPGCWYGKIDISDCFLSFPVHPDSQRLLALSSAESITSSNGSRLGCAQRPCGVTGFLAASTLPSNRQASRTYDTQMIF